MIPRRPVTAAAPKHVIAEYRHRTQTVTCVCGWQGSSAQVDARPSQWSGHIAANRAPAARP
jgi:translation elongation factor EF-Ts